MSTRSSVSTTCSDSGDDDSAGITTTGLMCSDRADARRKFGGFCDNQKGTRLFFVERPGFVRFITVESICLHFHESVTSHFIFSCEKRWDSTIKIKALN